MYLTTCTAKIEEIVPNHLYNQYVLNHLYSQNKCTKANVPKPNEANVKLKKIDNLVQILEDDKLIKANVNKVN